MKIVRFTLKSLSPGMLQNPASAELLESLRTKTPMQQKRDWTIIQEAGTKLYRSDDGYMGVPMLNIMACTVIAGTFVKNGKKALSTAKSTTIFDFLEFVDDFCPFEGCVTAKPIEPPPGAQADTKPRFDVEWKPFPMKGNMKNGANSVAVCINRPRIPHWTIKFNVRFDDKRGVDLKTVIALVEAAGRKVGLGDYGPRTRGRFGRFIVSRVETLNAPERETPIEMVDYDLKSTDIPPELLAIANAEAM